MRNGGTAQEMDREAPLHTFMSCMKAHHNFRRITCNRDLLLRGADLLPGKWSWA